MKIPRKNWLEWCVFGFGLVALVWVVGYLGRNAWMHDGRPPALSVVMDSPWQQVGVMPPYVVVPVTVRNDGDKAATEVDVEVTVVRGGEVVERAGLNIDELPRQSQRGGAVALRALPGPGELQARVLGYADP